MISHSTFTLAFFLYNQWPLSKSIISTFYHYYPDTNVINVCSYGLKLSYFDHPFSKRGFFFSRNIHIYGVTSLLVSGWLNLSWVHNDDPAGFVLSVPWRSITPRNKFSIKGAILLSMEFDRSTSQVRARVKLESRVKFESIFFSHFFFQ